VTSWNYAHIWGLIAAAQPDEVALQQGDRAVTWGTFYDQSARFASWLIERGVQPEAKVANYLYNGPEYFVGVAGAMLNRCVPVNTNYRYGEAELAYLFDNADAEVLVFHGTFLDNVEAIRAQLPRLCHFVFVDDGTAPCPAWAEPFVSVVATERRDLPVLTPDDLLFLYTGGTTGMPKGVMWRQDDLFGLLNAAALGPLDPDITPQDFVDTVVSRKPAISSVPACPLMHGTGLFSSMTTLSTGGRVVMLTNRHYDPAELADTIDAEQIGVVVIVGDPFARPLLRLLDAKPGHYHFDALWCMVSSGAMWSEEIKRGLLRHHGAMMLVDNFASSEALGMGSSISRSDELEKTARFTLGPNVRVADDDGVDVAPGSGDIGKLMLGGRNPLGYYKDDAKTLSTFRVFDGVRYSVPGDMATVNADGTIHLLGRGSQCINTAGEKVFPEEVEESLKTHPAVADACVVGVADDEYGQRIVAAVELHPNESCDENELIGHVKSNLASYKAPRAIRFVDTIGRAVNGKMDYARHQKEASDWMAAGI
jgi:3-oxocholest-4-en-26-oate---CoA ligase